eukprot:6202340-Pleurochrysis_carterae.AAC.1
MHTRTVPAHATSIDMGDAVEPEPMQADLSMQSDPGALAFFKDIANITDVNERSEWYRAHYAEIDELFDMPAGLRLVPSQPDLHSLKTRPVTRPVPDFNYLCNSNRGSVVAQIYSCNSY